MDRKATDRRRNPATENDILDLRDIARQVMRRKALALLLFAAPAFLGFVYIATRPAIYTATSSVLLEGQEQKQQTVENALPGMAFDNMTVETQANVIGSSALMRGVIEKLGLQLDADNKISLPASAPETPPVQGEQDAAKNHAVLLKYANGLMVTSTKSSRVIDITFASEKPFVAAEIANAHASEYVESQVRLKREQAQNLNQWIAEQVGILKKQSAEKSSAVQAFREENGIVTGRNSEDLIYQQISDIAAELVPVESRKLDLQARNDEMTTQSGINAAIKDSSVVQSLKTQAATARGELQALGAKYGQNHPIYVETRERVAQLETDISRETSSIRTSVKSELETVTAQEDMLKARLEDLKTQADALREKQVELKTLEFEADASAQSLDNFLNRYEEISSNIDFARPDVRIVSLADVPVNPQSGKKALMMVIVLFVSIAFSVAMTYLISLMDKGIRTPDDIRKHLNLRMLGALPDVANPVAEVQRGNRSTYLEEIKNIYLQLSGKPGVKTVQITAASAGEGKTSMTLAMAAYLASIGRKVIVIDADLHTPDVARIAGVEDITGLADVLAGKVDLATAIHRDERGIHILSAGSNPSGKLDLVGGAGGFAATLENLKSSYDYVLVDTAPLLESSDAGTVAGLADQTIMVVASGHTDKADLKKAAERLRQFSKEYPAAILTKIDQKDAA